MELTTEQRLDTIKQAFMQELHEILEMEHMRSMLVKEAGALSEGVKRLIAGFGRGVRPGQLPPPTPSALPAWGGVAPAAVTGALGPQAVPSAAAGLIAKSPKLPRLRPPSGRAGGVLDTLGGWAPILGPAAGLGVGALVGHPWLGLAAGAGVGALGGAGHIGRSLGRIGSAEAAAERVLLEEAAKKGPGALDAAQKAVQQMRAKAPLRPGLGAAAVAAPPVALGAYGVHKGTEAVSDVTDKLLGRQPGSGADNPILNLALMGGGAYGASQLPGLLGMSDVPDWMRYLLPIAGGVTAPAMFG